MNTRSVALGRVNRQRVREALSALGEDASDGAVVRHTGLTHATVAGHRRALGLPSPKKPGAGLRRNGPQVKAVDGQGPSKPTYAEPPLSTSYVILDTHGRPLLQRETFEDATLIGRRTPGAVAIVGAPSGVVLARVAHGAKPVSDIHAATAARRWLRGANAA